MRNPGNCISSQYNARARGFPIPYPSLPTKDELAAEWLRARHVRFWQRWEAMTQRHPGAPRKRLKAAFALLVKHVSEPTARGCGIASAAAAISGREAPARRAIEGHKAMLRARLAELCTGSGAAEPERLAVELFLLMESAHPTLILGVQGPERNVEPAAALLIDSRLTGEPS